MLFMYSYYRKFIFIFIFLLCKCVAIVFQDNKLVLNVRGNSEYLFFYYITLFIGEEKQNQSFILDTSTSITTAPCSLCASCGDHFNEYYIINDNSSMIDMNSEECGYLPNLFNETFQFKIKKNLERNNCKFYSELENEKIYGLYLNQLISFETISVKNNTDDDLDDYVSEENEFQIPIGCSLKETGFLQASLADGIIGLNNNNKSFVSMLYRKDLIKNNLFSICLDKEGGYLSLGDIDTKYHICSEINYIGYNQTKDLYEFETKKIIIKDIEIESKYISTINSASTISFFPEPIFNNISMAFFVACSEYEDQCGKLKRIEGYGICSDFKNINDSIKAIKYIYPSIKIYFKNYEFNWEPENYALNFSSKNKIRICFGIDTEKNLDKIILGTNFMHGQDIIFDRENGKIGFCEASCGRNMSEKNKSSINKTKIEKEKEKFANGIKNENQIQKNKIIYEENNITDINDDNTTDNETNTYIYNKEKDTNNKYYKYLIVSLIIIFILFSIFIFFNNFYNDEIVTNQRESFLKNQRMKLKYDAPKNINELDSSTQKIELVETEDNTN